MTPTGIGANLIQTFLDPCPEAKTVTMDGFTFRLTTGPTQYYVRKHGFLGNSHTGLVSEQILPSAYTGTYTYKTCFEARGLRRFSFIAAKGSTQDVVTWWPDAPSTSIFSTPVAATNLAHGPVWDYASDDGLEPATSRIYWVEHNYSTNLVTFKKSDPGFASVSTLGTHTPTAGYTLNFNSVWLGETILSFGLQNGSGDRIRVSVPREGGTPTEIAYDLQFGLAYRNQGTSGVPVPGGSLVKVISAFLSPWDDYLHYAFIPDSPTGASDFTKWGYLGCALADGRLNVNGNGLVTISGGMATTLAYAHVAVFETVDLSSLDLSVPPCDCAMFELSAPLDESIAVISAYGD